jgi:hypothetical protein
MAEQKTKPNDQSVTQFLDRISDDTRRAECYELLGLMKRVTMTDPKIWGSGLVGFGTYHYKYTSGHEGDCFIAGFASRKTALTVYITAGVERFPTLVAQLGKHKAGKGCLYIKRLEDVNLNVLEDLLSKSVEWTKATYRSGPK